MPNRRKRAQKPARKTRVENALERVAKDAKILDAHIRDLKTILVKGHYRVL